MSCSDERVYFDFQQIDIPNSSGTPDFIPLPDLPDYVVDGGNSGTSYDWIDGGSSSTNYVNFDGGSSG